MSAFNNMQLKNIFKRTYIWSQCAFQSSSYHFHLHPPPVSSKTVPSCVLQRIYLYSDQRKSYSSIPKLPTKKKFGKGKGPITWRNLLITVGIGSLFVIWIQIIKEEKKRAAEKERKRELGKAAIGGKFELVDHNGKTCTSDDFLGKWMLIYFGFTHCPDICPEEIEKMIEIVEILGKTEKLPKVYPVFITVDPERDTPEIVSKYIKEFSPKLIGLTGSKEQVHKVTKAYRVYYSAGPKDVDEDYIVDHTIIIYLINPNGEFVDYYGRTKTAEQVATAISVQMLKHMKSENKSWW